MLILAGNTKKAVFVYYAVYFVNIFRQPVKYCLFLFKRRQLKALKMRLIFQASNTCKNQVCIFFSQVSNFNFKFPEAVAAENT